MGPQHLRHGGNTPCIELTCGGHHLFFDAGSGLYEHQADKLDPDVLADLRDADLVVYDIT